MGTLLSFPRCFVFLGASFFLFNSAGASETPNLPLSIPIVEAILAALENGSSSLLAKESLVASKAAHEGEIARYRLQHTLETTKKRTASDALIGSKNRTDSSSIEYGLSKEQLLPSSVGSGKVTYQLGWDVNQTETDGSGSKSYQTGPKGSITLKQPLTKAGRITESSPPTQAELNFKQAQYQYLQSEEQTIFNVLVSYIDGLKAKQAVGVATETLKQTKQQVEITKVQVKLGVVAEIELSKLQVQLTLDKNAVVSAEKREKEILERLRNQLGLPEGTKITLTTMPPFRKSVMNVEELIRLARERRIDMRHFDIQQQLAEFGVQAAKSADDPVLNLAGSYDRQETEDRFGEAVGRPFHGDEKNWAASATVSLPLFDGGITRAATQRALSNQRSVLLEKKAREQEIGVEIQNTVSAVLSAEELYDTTLANLKLAEDTLKTDQFRYSRGEITTTDFLRSQLVLFQIKEAKNNALLDHFIAQVGLLQATQSLTVEAVEELVGEDGK